MPYHRLLITIKENNGKETFLIKALTMNVEFCVRPAEADTGAIQEAIIIIKLIPSSLLTQANRKNVANLTY